MKAVSNGSSCLWQCKKIHSKILQFLLYGSQLVRLKEKKMNDERRMHATMYNKQKKLKLSERSNFSVSGWCALKLNAQLKTNFLAKLSQSAPSAVQIDLSDSFHYKCQTGQTSFATRSKLWVWFKYKVNSFLFIILIGFGDTGFRIFGQINEIFLARKLNEQWT